MTWEMLKQDTYDSGFSAGEEYGIAIGEKLGEKRGISLGITQGAYQKAVETARNLLSKNIPQIVIAECTGLSIEEIEKL